MKPKVQTITRCADDPQPGAGAQRGNTRTPEASKHQWRQQALQEETLKADQSKNVVGAVTNYQVVQDQRDLATANSAVTRAKANYTHAKIALDQALGRTLEANNIALDEAKSGHVSRSSVVPTNLDMGVRQ